MARLFDDANEQALEYNGAVLTAVPISMACWFNTNDLGIVEMLMAISRVPGGSLTNNTFCLYVDGTIGGDPVKAGVQNNTFAAAAASAGPSLNTWGHACGVFASATSRAAYFNGANKGTNATNITPANVAKTDIARYYSHNGTTVIGAWFSGMIAEAGIWDIALTDAEVAVLATGISPLAVHPSNLVAYWPIMGRDSPEIDPVGGYGMTLSASAPVAAAHPRVRYPFGHVAR